MEDGGRREIPQIVQMILRESQIMLTNGVLLSLGAIGVIARRMTRFPVEAKTQLLLSLSLRYHVEHCQRLDRWHSWWYRSGTQRKAR